MDQEGRSLSTAFPGSDRFYVKAYIDFLDSGLLSLEEKVVFLVLKQYLDFRHDSDSAYGEVYPSIKRICAVTGTSKPTVIKIIKALADKGVIEKTQRGLNRTNAYIITDRAAMWQAKDAESVRKFATETDEEWALRTLRTGNYRIDGKVVTGSADRPAPPEYAYYDSLPDLTEDDGREFEVRLRDPERLYVKVYTDFLNSGKLSLSEIGMFIILKRFLDVRKDRNGTQGEVYPSVATLEERTGKSHSTVIGITDSLVKKGVLIKKVRGLNKTNLYVITDRAGMWTAENEDEMKARAVETKLQKAERILKEKGYTVTSDTAPRKGLPPLSCSKEEIERLLEADILKKDPGLAPNRDLIDTCVNIVWETLNSDKQRYRIDGEYKSADTVREVFLKLRAEDIIYAIDRYQNVTEEIKMPIAYLRSILYKAGLGEGRLAAENDVRRRLHDSGIKSVTIKYQK